MALKAHLFGWTIIQKRLTNTQSLSKFISTLLLIVHLLKLMMGSTQILMSCRLEGTQPRALETLGAFLGQAMPETAPTSCHGQSHPQGPMGSQSHSL